MEEKNLRQFSFACEVRESSKTLLVGVSSETSDVHPRAFKRKWNNLWPPHPWPRRPTCMAAPTSTRCCVAVLIDEASSRQPPSLFFKARALFCVVYLVCGCCIVGFPSRRVSHLFLFGSAFPSRHVLVFSELSPTLYSVTRDTTFSLMGLPTDFLNTLFLFFSTVFFSVCLTASSTFFRVALFF